MRTGLDGTSQHFPPPSKRKIKDKKKKGGGHWGLCVNDHSPNQILKIHSHKNFKMAGWVLGEQVGEKLDLFGERDLLSFACLAGNTLTLNKSRHCSGMLGSREPREGTHGTRSGYIRATPRAWGPGASFLEPPLRK